VTSGAAKRRSTLIWTVALIVLALAAPYFLYPVFLMRALCLALFACAFNLLLGYVGLLSFGHAAFMGGAAYITAHAVKVWGFPPEIGILAGVAAAAASTISTARITPTASSPAVVGVFALKRAPSSAASTASVKVPPTSTPSSIAGTLAAR